MDKIIFIDSFAMWPSKFYGGAITLMADGAYHTPQGSGTLAESESVAIDPSYPLYAMWTGEGWMYRQWE